MRRLLSLILPFFLLCGCETDKHVVEPDEPAADTTATDTIQPSVVATVPAHGDSSVPVNSFITITFSEDMDPSTISTETIAMSDGVTGTVTYTDSIATFIPSDTFINEHKYAVVVTMGAKDLAGNPLEDYCNWYFTTVNTGMPPPYIVSTVPADGDTGVLVSQKITATFSEEIDPAAINSSTFVLSGGITGVVSYGDKTATFTPDFFLASNYTYQATIKSGIADEDGNAMESDYIWSFTTCESVIMPLAVGNMWEYYVTIYDTNHYLLDSYYDTVLIIDDTLIESEGWFIDNKGELYANREDGLWRFNRYGQPFLSIPYPPDTTIIVTPVEVPAGAFRCYKYRNFVINPDSYYYYYNYYNYYYTPGVGLIQFIRDSRFGGGKWFSHLERWELTKFELQ